MSDTKMQLYIRKSGGLVPIQPKTVIPAVEGENSTASLSEVLGNLGRGEEVMIGRAGTNSFLYSPEAGSVLIFDTESVYIAKTVVGLSLDEIAERVAARDLDYLRVLTESSILDNLTSTATDMPLSANQGRILNEKMAGLDTWDGTEAEWNALSPEEQSAISTAYILEE